MTSPPPSHPLDRLSRADRRRWRRLDAGPRGRAGRTAVAPACAAWRMTGPPWTPCVASRRPRPGSRSWPSVSAAGGWWGGWRPGPGRSWRPPWRRGRCRLSAAGRYGPYWTLSFNGPAAPVTLLVSHLVVSEAHGGAGDDVRWPDLERAG